ncbi:lysozyme [Acinetobacter sp. 2JN-4]|uniref:glycoside hydrolase family protein n=1 Tax=Acinetobacter sp. 2JN-4 TaxID=2479844 RepID=UPI000EF9FE18|nr:glycoside hydrolase family protein [Acinetobacter sp. 2JN-4]RLZ08775.1 lysozyme [Acinetobacter sp. 2JN-4]
MQNKTRLFVVGSTVSAALIGGFFISGPSEKQAIETAKKEGFTAKPIIPTKGDVPTIGHGTTVYPNGVRVRMSDPAISREKGMYFLRYHMNKDADRFNKTILNVPIYQYEYDAFIDFTYQYGMGNWQKSSMLRNLKQGKYKQACDSLLKYKYAAGYDCSTPGNKRCAGVWTRQKERYKKCIGAQ